MVLPFVTLSYPATLCYPVLPCVTLCYPALPFVTLCDPVLPSVPLCFPVLPCVTLCYSLLPYVTLCYSVFPCVTLSYPVLPFVTLSSPLLPCVTLCYPLLLFVSLCYSLLPCVTLCYSVLPCVTHKLMIETGRYNQTSRNDSFCPICNSGIIKLKSNCIFSSIVQKRKKFYNKTQQNFVDFNQLSHTELIIKLMNSHNFSVNSHLLKFVSLCNDLRTNLLSNHADDA